MFHTHSIDCSTRINAARAALDMAKRMHALGFHGLAYEYAGDASRHVTASFNDLERGCISYRSVRTTLDDLSALAAGICAKRLRHRIGWRIVR